MSDSRGALGSSAQDNGRGRSERWAKGTTVIPHTSANQSGTVVGSEKWDNVSVCSRKHESKNEIFHSFEKQQEIRPAGTETPARVC